MQNVYEKLISCYESIQEKIPFTPKVALVLGSGLGDYAEEIRVEAELDYHEIDGFPVSTVPGHAGKFIFGWIGSVPVVCMKGRVHFYEGYPVSDVVLPIRLMKRMGAELLFLTNASGGINPSFSAGDLMLLTDHISLFAPNPLIGQNFDELGVRFPDMTQVYDRKLQEILKKNRGTSAVVIFLKDVKAMKRLPAAYQVEINETSIRELRQKYGESNVKLVERVLKNF